MNLDAEFEEPELSGGRSEPAPQSEEEAIAEPPIKGLKEAGSRLLKWLNAIVDNDDIQSSIALALVRLNIHEQEETVLEVEHDLDKPTPETVRDLLDAASTAAQRLFAEGLERADFSVKVEGRRDRLGFSLQTQNPPSLALRHIGSQHSKYAPDLEGLTAQAMDINLELTDRVVEQANANLRDKDRTISTLREELRISRSLEWRLRAQLEKMMDGSMKRTMMMEEFKRDQDRKDAYAEGFKNIAPPVVATLLGPEAGKAAALLAAFTSGGGGDLSKLLGGALGGAGGAAAFGGGEPDEDGADPMFFTMAVDTFSHVDAFIQVLETKQGLFEKLIKLLATTAPECIPHLRGLHNGSMARRAAKTGEGGPPGQHPGPPPNRATPPSRRG